MHRNVLERDVRLHPVDHRPAVHTRQHHVEQNSGRTELADQLQTRFAIASRQHAIAATADQLRQDAREGRIVLDDQDHRVVVADQLAIVGNRRRWRQALHRRRAGLRRCCYWRRRQRRRFAFHRQRLGFERRRFFGQQHGEGAAAAEAALHGDIATEPARHATGDRQAQPGTAELPAGAGIDLLEGLEHLVELVFRNADAGIADGYRQTLLTLESWRQTLAEFRAADAQFDLAGAGELEGIAEQVGDDLFQARGIGADRGRQAVVDVDLEVQLPLAGHVPEAAIQALREAGQTQMVDHHFELAGFDLGQIEDVVDQLQQLRTALEDDLGRLHFIRRQMTFVVVGQALRQDQETVQRRAQLVRHVGQEFALVLAGAGQCVGLFLSLALQLLQDHLLLLQGGATADQRFVGDLQLLGLQLQFFLGRTQLLRLLFE